MFFEDKHIAKDSVWSTKLANFSINFKTINDNYLKTMIN